MKEFRDFEDCLQDRCAKSVGEDVMAQVVDCLRNISNENSQSSERMEGYRILQSFAGILPSDFDYKKELEAMREEKYDRFNS